MSLSSRSIPELNKIVTFLGETEDIEDCVTKPLTAPGENYGSIMLQVDLKTNKNKQIKAVAKMVPKNEFIRQLFQSDVTFEKELVFYQKIVPLSNDFLKKRGSSEVITFAPKCLGGRLGLEDPQVFDFNAVILLENLKPQGFINVNRTVGFDFATSKMVLRSLAQFHGVALALKFVDPEVYLKEIREVVTKKGRSDESQEKAWICTVISDFLDVVQQDPFCSKYASQLAGTFRDYLEPKPVTSECYRTISHCDFWSNNTMVLFNENGVPEQIKIVDFQLLDEASVANDLAFFLFTSVENMVLISHYDDLIKEYHQALMGILNSLKVPSEKCTKKLLEEEIEIYMTKGGFAHVCHMLKPIFAPKEIGRPVEDVSYEFVTEKREATKAHKEKLFLMVKECIKRFSFK